MKKKGQLALVSTQLACMPCQYVCGLLLPFHLFTASSLVLKFSLNPSSGPRYSKYKSYTVPLRWARTLGSAALRRRLLCWWYLQHCHGATEIIYCSFPLHSPPQYFFSVPAGCLWSLPACQAQHCSGLESIWPTKQRACSWNLNVAKMNCFKNQGMSLGRN